MPLSRCEQSTSCPRAARSERCNPRSMFGWQWGTATWPPMRCRPILFLDNGLNILFSCLTGFLTISIYLFPFNMQSIEDGIFFQRLLWRRRTGRCWQFIETVLWICCKSTCVSREEFLSSKHSFGRNNSRKLHSIFCIKDIFSINTVKTFEWAGLFYKYKKVIFLSTLWLLSHNSKTQTHAHWTHWKKTTCFIVSCLYIMEHIQAMLGSFCRFTKRYYMFNCNVRTLRFFINTSNRFSFNLHNNKYVYRTLSNPNRMFDFLWKQIQENFFEEKKTWSSIDECWR